MRSLNWALALLSALLLVLAFPKADIAWLAPVALAPLLIAVAREVRWKRRFLLGWACGIAYWCGVCYWIEFVLSVHGGVGDVVGCLLLVLFALVKGLHMAVFGTFAGPLMRRWWAIPAVAALWVAIESTHGLLGFEWLQLGNAGIQMSLPMRLAPITGVYGISFVFAAMGTGVALVLLRRPRLHLAWLLIFLFVEFFPELPRGRHGHEPALLLQANISETQEWTPEIVASSEREQESQSLSGVLLHPEHPPEVIVWAEIPAPFYFYRDARYRADMETLARATRANLLFGTVAWSDKGALLNSAALVSPSGVAVSRYDKVNLVPFGEFVPWPFGFANKISTETGDFEPGTKIVVSPLGAHLEGTFICYESVFPDFVRQFTKQGAEVLFNISNDGWFGNSAARDQHLEIVRMRAAENDRWILRDTNDGITATIDPAGRVFNRLPSNVEASSYTQFNYVSDQTTYTRWGNWFPVLCAVVAVGCLIGEVALKPTTDSPSKM